MNSLSSDEKALRARLSTLFADYFLVHLKAELAKKDSLVQFITKEGVPYGQIVQQMIDEVGRQFPECSGRVPYNLFEHWVSVRDVPSYADSTFKLYGYLFWKRILDLRDGTVDSRRAMTDQLLFLISTGKYYGQGVTFRLYFRDENVMLEELRQALRNQPEIPFEAAHQLINDQTRALAETAYDYFDQVVRDALAQSDRLLANILPRAVADELKATGRVKPVHFADAAILFTDFVGFTAIASELAPDELVRELDNCFSQFDAIIEKYKLEKIKTIGDAYMAAAGIPESTPTFAVDIVLAALEIQSIMKQVQAVKESLGIPFWRLRIGIHSGPVTAGVIGEKKFAYDVWGDTVNTASRMEAGGVVDEVNISEQLKEAVKDFFVFEPRGQMPVKGKGDLPMFLVKGIRPELASQGVPNDAFRVLYARLGEKVSSHA